MSLFEKAGILLEPNENILKYGFCKGKVPKGVEFRRNRIVPLGIFRRTQKQQINWKDIDGDLILTNQRIFALEEEGMIHKNIIMYNLGKIVGVSIKKPLVGKSKIELLLQFGNPKTEKTALDVDSADDWLIAIKKWREEG